MSQWDGPLGQRHRLANFRSGLGRSVSSRHRRLVNRHCRGCLRGVAEFTAIGRSRCSDGLTVIRTPPDIRQCLSAPARAASRLCSGSLSDGVFVVGRRAVLSERPQVPHFVHVDPAVDRGGDDAGVVESLQVPSG